MDNEKAIKELTLMLLYLTSWEEKSPFETYRQSWKGYDFDVLNELSAEELIYDEKNRNKRVILEEKGIELAKELLKKYRIEI